MESAFRTALLGWLRTDPLLMELVNAVEEEAPVAASPPAIALAASASADWSSKTAPGREIRIALEILDRSEEPGSTAAIAGQVEQRIATLAPQQEGFRVVVTQFLRSRFERRNRNRRAALLEYGFKVLADG